MATGAAPASAIPQDLLAQLQANQQALLRVDDQYDAVLPAVMSGVNVDEEAALQRRQLLFRQLAGFSWKTVMTRKHGDAFGRLANSGRDPVLLRSVTDFNVQRLFASDGSPRRRITLTLKVNIFAPAQTVWRELDTAHHTVGLQPIQWKKSTSAATQNEESLFAIFEQDVTEAVVLELWPVWLDRFTSPMLGLDGGDGIVDGAFEPPPLVELCATVTQALKSRSA